MELENVDVLNPSTKFFSYIGLAIAVVFLLTVGSCTMHSNTFDKDRILANAELERANAASIEASSKAELEQIKAIEALIQGGVDPIAARCAVMGWDRTDNTCLMVSK